MEKIQITISREYGSGGRTIGELVAKKLQIPFYDRNLVDLAAEKSGLSKAYISQREETLSSRFVWNPSPTRGVLGQGIARAKYYTNEEKMYQTQTAIIQEIAEKGSCVIIGRCADYILKESHDCMRIFIHASLESRIRRVVQDYGVAGNNAADTVKRTDKGRAAYHNYYAGTQWGDCRNYHLAIDSEAYGLTGAAETIVQAAGNFAHKDSAGGYA